MLVVLAVLLCSLLVGWLSGGAIRNLAHLRLRATWLVFAAVGAQLLLALATAAGAGEILGRPLLSASHLALLAFITINRRASGMPLVLAGFAANAAVILVNGAMPVSPDALVAVGGEATVDPGKHHLLTESTRLPWLADVIPVPLLRSVISVGDVVLAAGVGILVVAQMRRFPPRPGRRLRPRPVPPLSRRARASRRGSPSRTATNTTRPPSIRRER